MKKVHLYFALIITLTVGYFLACEKITFTESPKLANTIPIDTVILDPKVHNQSASRSGDGFYDFVMLGSNYKGQTGFGLFLQDMTDSRRAILYWLSIFDPAYHIDTNKVRIHYANISQNLSCSTFSFNEGVSCSFDKIKKAVDGVSNGQFTVDRIGILGNGAGGGGSDGDKIFFVGLGNHLSGFCPFVNAAFDGIMWHELLHTYYINHVDTPCNKGSGAFTTNGGCAMITCPILPFYQQLIFNSYSAAVN